MDYPCLQCTEHFTNGEALIEHVLDHHTEKPPIPAPMDGLLSEKGSLELDIPYHYELQDDHTTLPITDGFDDQHDQRDQPEESD